MNTEFPTSLPQNDDKLPEKTFSPTSQVLIKAGKTVSPRICSVCPASAWMKNQDKTFTVFCHMMNIEIDRVVQDCDDYHRAVAMQMLKQEKLM
ncbi:hypothetical protein [Candidatus Igneacidithiobacillus taiwanensis]|uniref:hypothetical protein n=1 Tax=Candidatus Igneacidithiobacillus taiwanensis TaxID=1945924 RepID=UPI00289D0C72|nr:hypothetical protein [Candidatus Igneacidithiobacillus taiwanensis]